MGTFTFTLADYNCKLQGTLYLYYYYYYSLNSAPIKLIVQTIMELYMEMKNPIYMAEHKILKISTTKMTANLNLMTMK